MQAIRGFFSFKTAVTKGHRGFFGGGEGASDQNSKGQCMTADDNSAPERIEILRGSLDKIDARTRVYGVIGNPVAHSMGPLMHNRAFAEVGYNGVYAAFAVADAGRAAAGIRALGIRGVSITIPHKVAMMAHLDEIDAMAARIGAVNTLINHDGHLKGFNSDCLGAVSALSQKTAVSGKQVTIIGAGGAARAIGFGVTAAGGRVTVVNRTIEKGERLARALGAGFKPLNGPETFGCDILINTTSVGMTPNTAAMPVHAGCLEKGMVVMDIVYNPLRTKLLQEAQGRGCTIVDGVSMFVHQGARQFEWWTGQKAPRQVMEKTVRMALQA